jgi:hypothetical protein
MFCSHPAEPALRSQGVARPANLPQDSLLAAAADEPRLIWAFNGTLRLQTLPVALFSGGHVAFVQRNPWK